MLDVKVHRCFWNGHASNATLLSMPIEELVTPKSRTGNSPGGLVTPPHIHTPLLYRANKGYEFRSLKHEISADFCKGNFAI
ncbi:hypothetical protein KBK24_0128365 [Burkholderia sp. K24]|nr:hypothetical protein KBK24_0128365 [Burkholderia sp. K24]